MRPEWGEAQITGVAGAPAGRTSRNGAASDSIAGIRGAASSINSVFAGVGFGSNGSSPIYGPVVRLLCRFTARARPTRHAENPAGRRRRFAARFPDARAGAGRLRGE